MLRLILNAFLAIEVDGTKALAVANRANIASIINLDILAQLYMPLD